EVVQRDDDRKTADELRDEAVLEQVLWLKVLQRLGDDPLLGPVGWSAEPDRPSPDSLLDHLLEPIERATADEEDVRRVDLDEVLVGVLAATLWRDVGNRALEDLEQRLLH